MAMWERDLNGSFIGHITNVRSVCIWKSTLFAWNSGLTGFAGLARVCWSQVEPPGTEAQTRMTSEMGVGSQIRDTQR